MKLYVTDWNGAAIRDTVFSHGSFNEVLRKYGVSEIALEDFKVHRNNSIIDMFGIFGLKNISSKRLIHDYQETFVKNSKDAKLTDGFKESIYQMQNLGYQVVVLSNHITQDINVCLIKNKVFGVVVLANSGPEREMRKLDRLNNYIGASLEKEKSFIVGDSPEDIIIGKTLGIKTFSIDGDFHVNDIRLTKPDYYVKNYFEVMNLIKEN